MRAVGRRGSEFKTTQFPDTGANRHRHLTIQVTIIMFAIVISFMKQTGRGVVRVGRRISVVARRSMSGREPGSSSLPPPVVPTEVGAKLAAIQDAHRVTTQ